jgi:ligand-binding sensor domain-containing protein/signal transduction histidine kinase
LSLRNSNISRELDLKRTVIGASAVVVLACFITQADALHLGRTTSQYIRERWGSDRGFPGGSVLGFAQTPDGYLWIGTDKGLIRFDGLNFQVFERSIPSALPIGPIQSLLSDGDGNLWVLLQSTKILRYRDGKFEPGRDEAESGITAMSKQKNGAVLFSSLAYGPLTYRNGKFETLPSLAERLPKNLPGERAEAYSELSIRFTAHSLAEPASAVVAAAETLDGKVWLGTQDLGLFYMDNGKVSAVVEGEPSARITCLLPLADGKLWIGTENGVQVWNGMKLTQAKLPAALRQTKILAMVQDRDSNIWVGTARGLLRFNLSGVSSVPSEASAPSGPVTALFEDREGNLWIGGARSVERLRESAFVTYSVGSPRSESSGPIYVDGEQRAWFAPFEGSLHWLKNGKEGSVTNDGLGRDVVYSIAGSKDELWIGRRWGGLTHLRYGGGTLSTKTYTQADGLAQNDVFAVYRSRAGSVWAATVNQGVSEYWKGRFTTYSTANGMASNTVFSIGESPDGTMWFATPNGLNAFSKGRWRVLTTRDGLPSDNVDCLLSDSASILWIGTASGLAFLRSGQIQHPAEGPASLHEPILGIAEDRNGRLWIATSNHVLAAKRDSLLGSGFGRADVREYGFDDGLQSTEGVKRQPSVFADPFGRVWFSLSRGLSVVDSNRTADSSAPAMVHLEALFADGEAVELSQPLRLPPGGHKVTFRYAGLRLSAPEGVRYKYRLEGFDQEWSEPTAAREAVYTNLRPGSYSFRVMASNGDGVWSPTVSSTPFTVLPSFYQTWWFYSLGILAGVLLLWCGITVRVDSAAAAIRIRAEERADERIRIARELHDTLLQGVQGLLLSFHVAVQKVPADHESRGALEKALNIADRIILEGRNRVTRLRSDNLSDSELKASIEAVAADLNNLNNAPGTNFTVEHKGGSDTLHSQVVDEIFCIAREALTNAFRHSGASRIVVELDYQRREFKLTCRDNGRGFDLKAVGASHRNGHWGISGMAERAEKIGANFACKSTADKGTEVQVSLPACRAYVRSRGFRLFPLRGGTA